MFQRCYPTPGGAAHSEPPSVVASCAWLLGLPAFWPSEVDAAGGGRLGGVSDHLVDADASYPGQSLGLPEDGRGALAPWSARVGALVIDWGASMAVAVGAFGGGVLTERGWRAWTVLTVFVLQKALLTALTGSSFGQLITGVGVTRVGGEPVGWVRAFARAVMVGLVLPAVVVGTDRRGLDDLALDTLVVRRR